MFFVASKIFWLVASPLHLLLILVLAGLISGPRWRPGRALALAAATALAAIVFSPASALLIRPLEDRFPQQSENMPPPKGIIVLGGAVDEQITRARDQVTLNEAATRMTEGAALARLYPQALLVFSGGSSALIDNSAKEAAVARRLWRELGVPENRMLFEDRSRNTYENALFTKALVNPQQGEKWLLVTSAYHMPRAIGVFRALSMEPQAFPVDYRTLGDARDFRPPGDSARAMIDFEAAAREWIGLLAYRLTGKIKVLFPAP
jgi:uncharacterized SAM-binding protein YcdF (DUF218 family)